MESYLVSNRKLDSVMGSRGRQAVKQAITNRMMGCGGGEVHRATGTEGGTLPWSRKGQRRIPGGCHP